MSKITSRDENPVLSTCIKVTGNRTNYAPLQMSDESVYDLARHYYTLEEIAGRFKVSAETVIAKHSDAFNAGKENAHQKPRMILNQFFEEVLARETLLGPEVFEKNGKEVHHFLDIHAVKAMIELHAKKYEGLGSKQEVEISQKKPPAPEDIKFVPLTLDNAGDDWIK